MVMDLPPLPVEQQQTIRKIGRALGLPDFKYAPTAEAAHFLLQEVYGYAMRQVRAYNRGGDRATAAQYFNQARLVKKAMEAGYN